MVSGSVVGECSADSTGSCPDPTTLLQSQVVLGQQQGKPQPLSLDEVQEGKEASITIDEDIERDDDEDEAEDVIAEDVSIKNADAEDRPRHPRRSRRSLSRSRRSPAPSSSSGSQRVATKTAPKATAASLCPNPGCAGTRCCYKKKFSDGDKCGRPTCDKNFAQRTKVNVGERFCHFCQRHSKADQATLATCFSTSTKSKTWKSGSVTMSSCRRRFTTGTCTTKSCYHPSHVPIRPLNRGVVFGDWENVLNGEKMCGCVAYFLKVCAGKGDGCMEKMICACPGVCPEFKKEMNCPEEASLESSNATSLAQRRDLVGQASRIENDLDDALQGKCTSSTRD